MSKISDLIESRIQTFVVNLEEKKDAKKKKKSKRIKFKTRSGEQIARKRPANMPMRAAAAYER